MIISHDRRIAGITEAEDRLIAEKCCHIIADDGPIAEKCFHIIADDHDRWQYFQRSGDRERSYGN